MELATLIENHRAAFEAKYADRLLPAHLQALDAICRCRTAAAGEVLARCSACGQTQWHPNSCGHRSCPKCQNFEVTRWLERQREKLLPVDYFLVTFTLPAQLRPLAWTHQRKVYGALFAAAIATLKTFGLDPKHLGADMGMTAVLHTHSRRLTYHPHVHVVVPGGGVDAKHGIWKRTRYRYLFNEIALAKVFRAKLLTAIAKAGLRIPAGVPKDWVVDCRHAGRGESALEYLSRYLYRGVIGESNILCDNAGRVSFRYIDGETGQTCIETLPAAAFLWRIVQHVLPRGFHRVRDYGFLHHNARKTLQLIQLILQVVIKPLAPEERPRFCCCACGGPMEIIAVYPPQRAVAVSTSAQGPPEAIAA
jgi:hypothetical protein